MNRLELQYPTKPYTVTQNFGDNNACVYDAPALPISKRKIIGKVNGVCPVRYIELYPILGMKGHTGIDSIPGNSVPCFHAGPEGTVKEISTEPERGLGVGIVSNDKFLMDSHGNHYAKCRYWHFERSLVKLGDTVKTGDLIGYCDSTGISGGPHLHFELKPVEPIANVYINFEQNNGYYGAIDPAPFFSGQHAKDFPQIVAIGNTLVSLLKQLLALLKVGK